MCYKTHRVLWFSGLIGLLLRKIWCLHHGGVWLHHVNAFFCGNIPNFAQACESSWNVDRVFSVFACYVFFFFSPDPLGSDLLFFTSPTYQPPVSVAVKRNGWYFRGELVFPFLASIFYFNVSKCEYHCWAWMQQLQVSTNFETWIAAVFQRCLCLDMILIVGGKKSHFYLHIWFQKLKPLLKIKVKVVSSFTVVDYEFR